MMRAKMRVSAVVRVSDQQETIRFNAVGRNTAYPEDGSDEDNTFAKFTPSGTVELSIMNPALIGKFAQGDTFYLDFTKIEAEQPAAA